MAAAPRIIPKTRIPNVLIDELSSYNSNISPRVGRQSQHESEEENGEGCERAGAFPVKTQTFNTEDTGVHGVNLFV
jgi:hypothetical protein